MGAMRERWQADVHQVEELAVIAGQSCLHHLFFDDMNADSV